MFNDWVFCWTDFSLGGLFGMLTMAIFFMSRKSCPHCDFEDENEYEYNGITYINIKGLDN